MRVCSLLFSSSPMSLTMQDYRTPQKSTKDYLREPSTPYLAATAISPVHISSRQSPQQRRSPLCIQKLPLADAADEPLDATSTPDEARRKRQREKQVEFGLSTEGYTNMIRLVEHDPLLQSGNILPLEPPHIRGGSKRAWDIQLRKWRRALHMFDFVFIDGTQEEYESCVEEQRKQWVSVGFADTPKSQRLKLGMKELLQARRSPLVPKRIPVGSELRVILRSAERYESVRSVVPQSASSITRGTDISPLAAGIKIHIAPSSALVRRQMEQVEQQRMMSERLLSSQAAADQQDKDGSTEEDSDEELAEAAATARPDTSPSPKKPAVAPHHRFKTDSGAAAGVGGEAGAAPRRSQKVLFPSHSPSAGGMSSSEALAAGSRPQGSSTSKLSPTGTPFFPSYAYNVPMMMEPTPWGPAPAPATHSAAAAAPLLYPMAAAPPGGYSFCVPVGWPPMMPAAAMSGQPMYFPAPAYASASPPPHHPGPHSPTSMMTMMMRGSPAPQQQRGSRSSTGWHAAAGESSRPSRVAGKKKTSQSSGKREEERPGPKFQALLRDEEESHTTVKHRGGDLLPQSHQESEGSQQPNRAQDLPVKSLHIDAAKAAPFQLQSIPVNTE